MVVICPNSSVVRVVVHGVDYIYIYIYIFTLLPMHITEHDEEFIGCEEGRTKVRSPIDGEPWTRNLDEAVNLTFYMLCVYTP